MVCFNSDPNDPDYLWGIVELFEGEPEVGSFTRTELESLKVGKFKLPIERDLYFDPINALEVYNGLSEGKHFAKGGGIKNQYEGRTPENVWNNLSKAQRQHFLYDHAGEIEDYRGEEYGEFRSNEIVKAYNSIGMI